MCLAVPTLITEISGTKACVDLSGLKREVSILFTPQAKVGDYVLIHAGYAIGLLSAEEAAETLELLREMELP